ncbi:MAG: PorT family protein [Prevotellaceae bacterium]|jgi:hypothetical protein|nr:PorT family protein [Prevotellaceae bacterium]
MNIKHTSLAFLLSLPALSGFSQNAPQNISQNAPQEGVPQEEISWRSFDFKIKAGINIGGTAPMGIPAPIRKINTFNPLVSLSIEVSSVWWFDARWGLSSGVRLENKGMTAVAQVKEYPIRLRTEDGELQGLFSGEVKTEVKNGYLNIPLALHYRILPPLNVRIGGYYSLLIDPSFTGSVCDGYLRNGHPGFESNMNIERENPRDYEFSDDMNKHDFGLVGGVEWNAYRHLVVSFDLAWGLRSVFAKGFTGVSFPMYNIYANVAFGYRF